MAQRKSGCRWGQACPASLSIAKSAEAEKAGATQHSPKQRSQSARRPRRALPGKGCECSRSSDNLCVSRVGPRIPPARIPCAARRALPAALAFVLLLLAGVTPADAGGVTWERWRHVVDGGDASAS